MSGTGAWRNLTAPAAKPSGRIFADAEVLWQRACEYFTWCDSEPWHRSELAVTKAGASLHEVPVGRPYTMEGLTMFLGVSSGYFRQAEIELAAKVEKGKARRSERDVLEVIRRIRDAIRCQQIEGASVGLFTHSIVARINGLAERQDVTTAGEKLVSITVRDAETADALRQLEEEA